MFITLAYPCLGSCDDKGHPKTASGDTPPGITVDSLSGPPSILFEAYAGTHALSVPWYLDPVNDRFNPAIIFGAQRTLRPAGFARLLGSVDLGFFQSYWWMTAVFANCAFGMERSIAWGLVADLRLGLGYMHFFWRRKTLAFRDGKYVSARDWGHSSLLVPLSTSLGYEGTGARPWRVSPFLRLQWAVQTPVTEEAAVMTHLFFFVGTRIRWGGNPIAPAGGP
jgi:hypothetical protein